MSSITARVPRVATESANMRQFFAFSRSELMLGFMQDQRAATVIAAIVSPPNNTRSNLLPVQCEIRTRDAAQVQKSPRPHREREPGQEEVCLGAEHVLQS